MNEQPELTVEITEKATKFEVDCWRVAHSKAATEQEAAEAAIKFFRSLRQRNSRYLVRELGLPKVSVLRESASRNDYNAGV
jgi:hypothetical protein